MKQTTKRFVSLVGGLFLIVGAFIVYFDFIRPAHGEVQTLKAEVLAQENIILTQKTTIAQVEKLIQDYQGEGREIHELISSALPLSSDGANVVAQLSGLLTQHSLTLSSITITGESPVEGIIRKEEQKEGAGSITREVRMLNTGLTFSGSYENMKKFLKTLENNVRIFDVKNIAFGTPEKATGEYKYNVELVAYYQES